MKIPFTSLLLAAGSIDARPVPPSGVVTGIVKPLVNDVVRATGAEASIARKMMPGVDKYLNKNLATEVTKQRIAQAQQQGRQLQGDLPRPSIGQLQRMQLLAKSSDNELQQTGKQLIKEDLPKLSDNELKQQAKLQQKINSLTQLSEQGDVQAKYDLGLMYAKGKGVKQDFSHAVSLMTPKAKKGDSNVQYNLGAIYDSLNDLTHAAKWYTKAADQGHARSQYNLGVMYAKGQGVPQDFTKAASWYKKAVDQGHKGAEINLGLMYKELGVPYKKG